MDARRLAGGADPRDRRLARRGLLAGVEAAALGGLRGGSDRAAAACPPGHLWG
jgi:hypothetical protein